MAETKQQNISPDALKTAYVTPEDCVFSCGDNGFLSAEINGTVWPRVLLLRSLPLTAPEDYICITDVDRNELGIIEHIGAFAQDQQDLIHAELAQRYFCPCVTEILDIKEKMGNFYFDVMIGDFKRAFTVKDITKSIRQIGGAVILIDLDGNRFRIDDIAAISKKSRRKLEPYLY
ncbi:MAG: DUF1854 domain-containing protein [Clostridia bacterium]|nr:DUF1854 domain-containing protein [Clostridia bacterium]